MRNSDLLFRLAFVIFMWAVIISNCRRDKDLQEIKDRLPDKASIKFIPDPSITNREFSDQELKDLKPKIEQR